MGWTLMGLCCLTFANPVEGRVGGQPLTFSSFAICGSQLPDNQNFTISNLNAIYAV